MNVCILPIDGKIKNIACEKIRMYHENRGDTIYDMDIFINISDIVYVSTIFSWNKCIAESYLEYNNAIIGGSGVDIFSKLPPEIDAMKPKINLGFATRGCNNNCSFCIVHQKEGNTYIENDLYDIWDGKSKDIVLLDNNILQLPEHFRLICDQARKEKIRLDFNQGLDHKLLNDDICMELSTIRHKEYHFAFDDIKYEKTVLRAIDLLSKHGIKQARWYLLVGYNSTIEDDLYRMNLLKSRGHIPYVMRYETCRGIRYTMTWRHGEIKLTFSRKQHSKNLSK